MRRFVVWFLLVLFVPALGLAQQQFVPAKPAPTRHRDFLVPDGLRGRVNFWRDVFAKYGKAQVIIHHRRYPQLIFMVVDMQREFAGMNPIEFDKFKSREVDRRIDDIKVALKFLRTGQAGRTPLEKLVEQRMAPIPGGWTKYKQALDDDLVRSQTGIREKMADAIRRSGRYLPLIEKIFTRDYNIPIEVTRLPFVESSFDYTAYSSVGAAGIWQFMPRTARSYMIVNNLVDERRDPIESSEAAAKYFLSSFNRLGNWPLAIISYNHGVGGVAAKARSAGTTDVVKLIEGPGDPVFGFASSNFYPSFLAALEVYDERRTLFPGVDPEPSLRISKVRIPRPTGISLIGKQLGLHQELLRRVNYALSERIWEGKANVPAGYVLKVPQEYEARMSDLSIPEPPRPTPVPGSPATHGGKVYRVKKGDTLGSIAKEFNLAIEELQSINRIKGTQIKPGQALVVSRVRAADAPTPKPKKVATAAPKAKAPRTHKVKRGETLSDVADEYGTTVKKLKAVNGLKGDGLRPGQQLRIP